MGDFEYATMRLTDGQQSAIATLCSAQATGERDAIESVKHWIRSWDRSLGRTDTLYLADRISAARQRWAGYIFEDGAGI